MNKKNNKGFSLIELIVVVAIMAVLVGVLAPTYLRYVEKTRAQKDESAVAEVIQAVKVACAEEKVANEVTSSTQIKVSNKKIEVSNITGNDKALETAIKEIVGDVEFTSKTHKDQTYTIEIASAGTAGIVVKDYDAENGWGTTGNSSGSTVE